MAEDLHSRNQLHKLLTPATGDDLDKLVAELVGPVEHTGREVSDKPLFFKAAEARAARQGISADRLLADYTARLESSRYPSLECLLPEEVQQVTEGQPLAADQAQHVAGCAPCRQLLNAAQLPRERREALLQGVAAQTTGPAEVAVVDQVEAAGTTPQSDDRITR
jgi:hypothetical protein